MKPRAEGQKSDTSSCWTEVSGAQHTCVPGPQRLWGCAMRRHSGLGAALELTPSEPGGGQHQEALTARGLGFRHGLCDGALLPGGVRGPGG